MDKKALKRYKENNYKCIVSNEYDHVTIKGLCLETMD